MQVAILCGGRGTRLRGPGEEVSKALVEIGGRPILWHIMKHCAHFGFRDFLLCLGYQADQVRQYIERPPQPDVTQDLKSWNVRCVDTGPDTEKGGRLKQLEKLVSDDRFLATYGDGLTDLDLGHLLDFHLSHGRLATVTAVRPVNQFGVLHLDGDGKVRSFVEKPRLDDWVNGGFFIFERGVFDYLQVNSHLERETLVQLAGEEQLVAYRHDGFWVCMDTYKDTLALNELWEQGTARWKLWRDAP